MYSKYNPIFSNAYPLSIFQKNFYEFMMTAISIPSLSVWVFFLPSILRFSHYSLEFAVIAFLIFLTSNALNIVLRRIIHLKTRVNNSLSSLADVKVLANNRLMFNVFWRKSIIVIALFMAFVFKVGLLTLFLVGSKNNSSRIEAMSMYFFLFASPLIIFTYVFNNVYGLLPQVTRWFSRQRNLFTEMFISYLFLICTPLIIDIIVTFSFLFAMNKLDSDFILNYFILAFLLIINGFLGSIYRPVFIKVLFSNFKSNTDMLISFFSILILGSVFYLQGIYKITALLVILVAFLFYFKFIKKTLHKHLLVFGYEQ
jgi:hypothetical protein